MNEKNMNIIKISKKNKKESVQKITEEYNALRQITAKHNCKTQQNKFNFQARMLFNIPIAYQINMPVSNNNSEW